MIKISYRELSPGLHAQAEPEGADTVIYLLPGLTPEQRRAALRRIRHSGRMGHGPRVPLMGLALALAADRIKTTARNCVAVVRLHPAGSTLPVALLSVGTVIFIFTATVSIHVLPSHRTSGSGPLAQGPTAPAPAPSQPAVAQGSDPVAGNQDRAARTGQSPGHLVAGKPGSSGASGSSSGPSSPGQTSPAAGSAAGQAGGAGSAPAPVSGSGSGSGTGSGAGSGLGSGSGTGSGGTGTGSGSGSGSGPGGPAPAPSPSPSPSSGGGLCLDVGPLGVCLKL